MHGPLIFSTVCVDQVVPLHRPGAYGLSSRSDEVEVVDFSVSSLREELRVHAEKIRYFWFDIALTAHEAYQLACELYHGQSPKKASGVVHPSAPPGPGWVCPVCHSRVEQPLPV
jgi:hypothetical protein